MRNQASIETVGSIIRLVVSIRLQYYIDCTFCIQTA